MGEKSLQKSSSQANSQDRRTQTESDSFIRDIRMGSRLRNNSSFQNSRMRKIFEISLFRSNLSDLFSRLWTIQSPRYLNRLVFAVILIWPIEFSMLLFNALCGLFEVDYCPRSYNVRLCFSNIKRKLMEFLCFLNFTFLTT